MNISDYVFNIGDEVITEDCDRGKIVRICDCEFCKERGFYELTYENEHGDWFYVTKYDAESGFDGYYKIGNYMFGNLRKDRIERDILHHKEILAQLEKQLRLYNELAKED